MNIFSRSKYLCIRLQGWSDGAFLRYIALQPLWAYVKTIILKKKNMLTFDFVPQAGNTSTH